MKNIKKQKQYIDKNPIEQFKELGDGVMDSLSEDLGKGVVTGLWEQLLSTNGGKNKNEGDLAEGEELNLARIKNNNQEEKKAESDPGINYKREILDAEKSISSEFGREIEVKIQEIIIELKRIASTSKEIQAQFKQITVEKLPANPGKYHLTFFEWMVSVVKQARMKVEDSANWLSVFSSKKKKKQYWSMFKKHGTSFGLSNERVVATQTG